MDNDICDFCFYAIALDELDDSVDDIFCDKKGCVFEAHTVACEYYVDEDGSV